MSSNKQRSQTTPAPERCAIRLPQGFGTKAAAGGSGKKGFGAAKGAPAAVAYNPDRIADYATLSEANGRFKCGHRGHV